MKTHEDRVLKLFQNGINFSAPDFISTSKGMNRKVFLICALPSTDNEIHSAERYRPVRLITAKETAKVCSVGTFLIVSIGNKIVTSSLPATECALVLDMQTEAGTPNMNVVLTTTLTIRAPSLKL